VIACSVTPLTNGTCHPVAEPQDGELRCSECGCRMFSSIAAELEANGQRCVRCLGPVELVPGPAIEGPDL
jgi:hypothetical protein